MTDLRHARSFRDLVVYQTAFAVAQEIFDRSRKFPKDEMFSLTDQLRRSSRSVGAQLAEAWGKRRYERHFLSELTDADAEQLETQHWDSGRRLMRLHAARGGYSAHWEAARDWAHASLNDAKGRSLLR